MYHIQQAIGILGGTFDPIHFGHLRTALEIYQAFDLAKIKFIPCYQPVHRKLPIATAEQRLAMIHCAISGEAAFSVDECEIQRQGPSYTIDTLEFLHQQAPHTPLCLMMGIDALLGFASWHRWEDILKLAHLIVVHRPRYQLPSAGIIADLLKQRLKHSVTTVHESLGGNIILQPITSLEISATEIRKLIAADHNPRYLLPDAVYDYIKQHGVYSLSRL